MSDIVLKIENLGKKYTIGHQTENGRYMALRDVLMQNVRSFWYKTKDLVQGRPIIKGDTQEEVWALKDVSFEIRRGEVVGIIGRNGAGKSTLLKVLSRITEPSTGRVTIKGRIASLLEVGTGFHPELSGRENIYLNGAILGMTRQEIKRKFDEIVAFAEVEKYLDTPVKRYSSGMYVRLAFAVAAHLEPEILLVDEVLAVGDAAFQKKCLGKMGDVAREGRTVLFVSHNMGAINALCPKTVLLEQGSIVLIGDSSRVTETYLARQSSTQNANKKGCKANLDVINKQQEKGIKINKVELVNPKKPKLGAMTGDPLLIRISYSANRQFLSPAFVVSLKDLYGQEVVRLSTMPISGYQITRLYHEGYLDLLIESLPLVAGRYYTDIGFVREQIEWILRLENAVEFEVQAQDVYGSGFLLDRSRGIIIVNHKWDHKGHGKIK